MFGVRLISGILLLLVTIVLVVTGGSVLLAVLGIISLIGQYELYRALKLEKSPLAIIGYLATAGYELLLFFGWADFTMLYSMLFLMALMVCYVLSYPKFVTEQAGMVFLGFFYVSVMLSYIYQVRVAAGGLMSVWLIFIAAWGSDTCAYATGMLIGKHKLPSALSPKKSIEGCIGGVFGAALIGLLYAIIFKDGIGNISNPVPAFAVICGIGSVVAQFGDLAASAVKRNHDIKDYGKLIPGHGGILDRFDSIIFTAPVVFFLVRIFT